MAERSNHKPWPLNVTVTVTGVSWRKIRRKHKIFIWRQKWQHDVECGLFTHLLTLLSCPLRSWWTFHRCPSSPSHRQQPSMPANHSHYDRPTSSFAPIQNQAQHGLNTSSWHFSWPADDAILAQIMMRYSRATIMYRNTHHSSKSMLIGITIDIAWSKVFKEITMHCINECLILIYVGRCFPNKCPKKRIITIIFDLLVANLSTSHVTYRMSVPPSIIICRIKRRGPITIAFLNLH